MKIILNLTLGIFKPIFIYLNLFSTNLQLMYFTLQFVDFIITGLDNVTKMRDLLFQLLDFLLLILFVDIDLYAGDQTSSVFQLVFVDATLPKEFRIFTYLKLKDC